MAGTQKTCSETCNSYKNMLKLNKGVRRMVRDGKGFVGLVVSAVVFSILAIGIVCQTRASENATEDTGQVVLLSSVHMAEIQGGGCGIICHIGQGTDCSTSPPTDCSPGRCTYCHYALTPALCDNNWPHVPCENGQKKCIEWQGDCIGRSCTNWISTYQQGGCGMADDCR